MSVLAALVVLALAEPARPGAVHLEWDAPPTCPDAASVSAQIDVHLAGTPLAEPPVEVSARVTRDGGGFELALRTVVRGQPGTRTLRARDCSSLARAAALVVALAVDPDLAGRTAHDEPPPAKPEPEPDPIPAATVATTSPPLRRDAPPAPLATTTPPPRRTSLRERFALRLLGGVEVGALPGLGALVGVALAHVWPRARVEAFAVYLTPRTLAVPYEGSEGAARFQLGAAGVRGCGQIVRKRIEVPLCLGLEAGALPIATRDFRPEGTRRAPWVAASGGVQLVVRPLRMLGLVLAADLVVPFTRPGTVVGEPVREVHRPTPVTGRVTAGIELRFP